jgi:hypothetical protein
MATGQAMPEAAKCAARESSTAAIRLRRDCRRQYRPSSSTACSGVVQRNLRSIARIPGPPSAGAKVLQSNGAGLTRGPAPPSRYEAAVSRQPLY